MHKIYITNLGMVITEQCNFQCAHCMRENRTNRQMTEETMRLVFDRLSFVGNLNICGGEPLFDYDLLETLVKNIFHSFLPITSFTLITNGSLYTDKVEALLTEVEHYIRSFFSESKRPCKVLMSSDPYHAQELTRMISNPEVGKKCQENIARLQASPFFYGYKTLDKVIDVGKARNLDVAKIHFKPYPQFYYLKQDQLWCGPSLTILTDGVVSECDGDFEELRQKYNYGNVHEEDLETIIRKRAKRKSKHSFDNLVF